MGFSDSGAASVDLILGMSLRHGEFGLHPTGSCVTYRRLPIGSGYGPVCFRKMSYYQTLTPRGG